MPILPDKEELRRLEVRYLKKAWSRIRSTETPATLFGDLDRMIKPLPAKLSMHSRIRIAEAMADYCCGMRDALEAEEMTEAKRLVRAARRAIDDLHSRQVEYEQRLRAITDDGRRREVLTQGGRECWEISQDVKQHYEKLDDLARGRGGVRLSNIAADLFDIAWNAESQFRYSKYESMRNILDGLLKGWGAATGSKRGRAWPSKLLSNLIIRLAEAFEGATDRPLKKPSVKDYFMPFLNRILTALPPGMYNRTMVTDAALLRRVERRLRSQAKTATQRCSISAI